MIEGKTKTGFEYKLDDNKLNNYELVEALGELEENPITLPKVVRMLLGTKQTNDLKNHLRLKDGTVPVDKMEESVTEIFQNQSVKK